MRILIPTDFSHLADHATVMADKFKRSGEDEIHFLHVVQWGDSEQSRDGKILAAEDEDGELLVRRLDEARGRINELAKKRPDDHFHVQIGIRTRTIVKFGEEKKFDLIVMGTSGARGLKKFLTGSETQHVARFSEIPVLSVMCDRSDLDIRDILIVHDFAHRPKTRIKVLNLLENYFRATIHLLYVDMKNGKREDLLEKIESFAEINDLKNFEAHIHRDSDVSLGVTHFNQMRDMDMIVIGTEGRKGLGRILKSSVAEKLINNLYKPIITFHL